MVLLSFSRPGVEAVFLLQPAKVTAHWHKGTTFMVRFESSVLARDAQVDSR